MYMYVLKKKKIGKKTDRELSRHGENNSRVKSQLFVFNNFYCFVNAPHTQHGDDSDRSVSSER